MTIMWATGQNTLVSQGDADSHPRHKITYLLLTALIACYTSLMSLEDILLFTRADQPGAIALRGLVWLIGVLVVATAVDKNKSERGIRVDAGWFFLFLFSAGIISYLVFGFIPTF